MKVIIDKIIASFTKDEYREFKYFLLRRPNTTENRKDLLMLESFRHKKQSLENTNAAHQIKKGLRKQLEQFTLLENLRHDKTSEIRMQIDIVKYLFHKNLYTEAWGYLAKAEKAAKEAAEYRLLDQILDLQISYSYNLNTPTEQNIAVLKIIDQKLNNQTLLVKESNANIAYAELIYQIKNIVSQNTSTNIDELKKSIFRKYGVEENNDIDNIAGYCNYTNVILVIFREEKNHEKLREHSINCYDFLDSNRLLDKVSDTFTFNLLDHICVSTIRTKDYINYEKFIVLWIFYAQKLPVDTSTKKYYDFIQYIELADLYLVTNRLQKAKENLLIAKQLYDGNKKDTKIFSFLKINFMTLHFICMEYDKCVKLYQEFVIYNEKKFLRELYFNVEGLLLTDIYGILFYYEDGDSYYALYLLTQLKRKYAAVLKSEASAREYTFIRILQRILKNPSYIKSESFLTDAEAFVLLKQFIPGDWEYVSLNAWLISKSTHRSYYDCFLDEVKP